MGVNSKNDNKHINSKWDAIPKQLNMVGLESEFEEELRFFQGVFSLATLAATFWEDMGMMAVFTDAEDRVKALRRPFGIGGD